MATTTPTMSPSELIDVSVTAWVFTDEDLSESPSSASASAFSAFSFSPSPAHSPPVSPLSTTSSPKRAKRLFQNIAKSPLIDVDAQSRIIDWRSYYNSLTPTTADLRTPPTLTPTPTTATTRVGTPSHKDSLDKPRLCVVIPSGKETPVEKTFARRRRAVPKPLTLWDFSNARGAKAKPSLNSNGKKPATSLPGSPFMLVKPVQGKEKESIVVQTPCDILSAVEFDLQAALQSATQNIPVSVRKVREYEDQWKYYRDDPSSDDDDFYEDDDDDYMSDPGTSFPDSALYTPFYRSPVQKKVLPTVHRGKQNPFPVRSMRKTAATDAGDAPAPQVSTVSSRLDLLRKRYHDVKIATPVEQEAIKSALMSPAI